MSDIQMDKETKDYLDAYRVDFPNEDEMETSINYIMAQATPSNRQASRFQEMATPLISNSVLELLHFGRMFWVLNSLYLLLGIISLIRWNTDPYLTAFILAPLPFIIGIFELVKSKKEGLVELEMTFLYNAQQVFTSRLLVVGVYNLFINFVVSAVCIAMNPKIMFVPLLLSWSVPYVCVSGIAYYVALKTRGTAASGILLAIWFAGCYGVLQLFDARELAVKMDTLTAIGTLLAGILIWTRHLIILKRVKTVGGYYET